MRLRDEAHGTPVGDPDLGAQPRDLGAHGALSGRREIGPAVPIQLLIAGEEFRPVAGEAGEEVLARSGAEVEEVGPDAGRAGLAGCAHDVGEESRPVRESRQDRRHPDTGRDAGVDERLQRAQTLAGRRGARLGRPPDPVVERGDRERDGDARAACGLLQDVDVADDERPAGDDPKRGQFPPERLQAVAREPVTALRRLVRIGRRADRHRLVLPRRARELATQHLGDVRLDADRAAVAVVGGPVSSPLEGPHVAEGAAVDAAHVRVQRPRERHPTYPVERRAARLFAVGHAHRCTIEHVFAWRAGRPRSLPRGAWERSPAAPRRSASGATETGHTLSSQPMCFELDSEPPVPAVKGAAVAHDDLVLEAADGNRFAAFRASPEDTSLNVGVVILPDVRGLYRFYEELALRFAERGYHALAIDYFGRTAGIGKRGDDFDYMEHVNKTTGEGIQADVRAAVEHTHEDGYHAVFTVGFCFGGRHSWLAAAGRPRPGRAGGLYGPPPAGG